LTFKGGSHLLLAVDVDTVIEAYFEGLVDAARVELRAAEIGYTGLGVDGAAMTVTIRDDARAAQAVQLIGDLDPRYRFEPGRGAHHRHAERASADAARDRRGCAVD